MAGPGFQLMIGVGRLFITAGGIMIIISDGSGFPIMNGALHGYHGEALTGITDGNQWVPESALP